MAEILAILSVISFLLAGAFGTAAIALWLRFDIPEIIGDLSGRAARRSVRRIREENARAARAREDDACAARAREERARAERDATEHLEDIMIIHTDEVI